MLVLFEFRRDRALHNFGCLAASTVLTLYRACVTAGHSKRGPRDNHDHLLQARKTKLLVSRHGGDEFLYLLMEIKEDQDAAIVAKKIIKAVQVPCDVSVGELTVNTSIGISIYPRDGTTVEALIKNADAAMYRAKQSKSGYSFSSDAPTQPA